MADIPVNASDAVTIVAVTVNGQVNFDYDFRADFIGDLKAEYRPADGSDVTILVGGTDFTATGLQTAGGGTITLLAFVTVDGDEMAIYRDITVERGTDYTRDLFSDDINAEQDRIFMILQEVVRDLERSFRAPFGVNPSTPAPAENFVIGWNDQKQLVNIDPATFVNMAGTATAAQGLKADTAMQPDAENVMTKNQRVVGPFALESLGPTSPPNGIFLGAGGNSLSFQTLISNPSGGGDTDNQRGSVLIAATTSDDGNSEEQTLCVLTTIETGQASAWAQSTAYTVGQNARIDAVNSVYRCITAGTSAASGTGPSGTGQDIVDGTVHWKWINDAAILAKVGIYNETVAAPGGGSAWSQANNIEFATGYTGTFAVNTEFDTTNDAAAVNLGGANYHNLYIQSNGNRITSIVDIGSSNAAAKAAFWALHFTGAHIAERAVICVDANAPIGLGFGDGAGGVVTTTFTDAVIKDNSNAPYGIKLDGTYATAQIAGADFAVTPTGLVSAWGFQTQFHAPASSADTGSPGEIRADINFIYVCTGVNTWKRVALSTF